MLAKTNALLVILAMLLSAGCATKSYVQTTVEASNHQLQEELATIIDQKSRDIRLEVLATRTDLDKRLSRLADELNGLDSRLADLQQADKALLAQHQDLAATVDAKHAAALAAVAADRQALTARLDELRRDVSGMEMRSRRLAATMRTMLQSHVDALAEQHRRATGMLNDLDESLNDSGEGETPSLLGQRD